MKKYDEYIVEYRVIVYDNVNGLWRKFSTTKRYTEEEAIALASRECSEYKRVSIEKVTRLEGWYTWQGERQIPTGD